MPPRSGNYVMVAKHLSWEVGTRGADVPGLTTIYRKMKAGTFPQPARVWCRRVAWRESKVAAWQRSLEVRMRG